MNISRFNEVYKQFINNIVKKFKFGEKELKDKIEKNLETNNKYYINLYIKNILPYIDEISACNIDFFKYIGKNIFLCDDLKFTEIIDKIYNNKTKKYDIDSFHKTCTYFMTLYLILLKDETAIEKYINANYCDYETYSQMISVINEKESIVNNWKQNNTDKNLDKIKINKEKELKETEEKLKVTEKNIKNNEKKNSMPSMPNFPFGDIENTQIGKLANELASKIEGDDNIEMPNITNPADIFSMMFSGGENPLGNIMTKVCTELDSKIKNGDVDQKELFKEAQGLMGNNSLFNPENMPNMDSNSKKESSKPIKIKRKKKKKKPIKKEINGIDVDQDNMLEETLNEVINE